MYLVEANDILYFMDKKRVQTELTESGLGAQNDNFKAAVMRLYRSCRPKLGYHSKKPSIQALQKLGLDRYIFRPHDLTLNVALEAFVYLIDFLEYDGVTHFEDKKTEPGAGVIVAELV